MQNCTFITEDLFRSVYSEQSHVKIINSLFRNEGKEAARSTVYFNENIEAFYSDLIGTGDTQNHNFDIPVTLNGCYYVDCGPENHPLADKGNPDFSFDYHMPPGCKTDTNDVGVSGGQYNPVDLCDYQDTLLVPVDIKQNCDEYTLKSLEDDWENYHWILPDGSIIDTTVNPITLTLELPSGNAFFRLMTESMDPFRFGFGSFVLDVEKLSIEPLDITNQANLNGLYEVDSIPFWFHILATINDMPSNYSYSWVITSTSGVQAVKTDSSETELWIKLTSIDPDMNPISFEITYTGTDEDCNVTVMQTIEAEITTECLIPEVVFVPDSPDNSVLFNIRVIDSLMIQITPPVIFHTGEPINATNIRHVYSLEYESGGEVPSDPVISEIGQITYLVIKPGSLATDLNQTYVLSLHGDSLMTADCKIFIDANPEKKYTIYTDAGIDDQGLSFNVYPNPVHDILFIRTGINSSFSLKVYSITGQTVMNVENISDKLYNLDLSALPPGLYTIRITGRISREQYTIRFIKE